MGLVISTVSILLYALIVVPPRVQLHKRNKRAENIKRLEVELGYRDKIETLSPSDQRFTRMARLTAKMVEQEREFNRKRRETERPQRLRKQGVWLPGDKR